MQANPEPPRTSPGPALVGLAMLGWGLSMVLGLVPHEDKIIGAGLAAFGAALLATRPGLPRVPRVNPWIFAGLGLGAIGAVLGFWLILSASFDIPKIALLVLGVVLVAVAPFVDHKIRLPVRGRPLVPLGNLATWSLAMLGTPLAMWGLQAAFKGVAGTTPVEAFIRVALIPPVAAVLYMLGLNPTTHGQMVTFDTPRGLLNVDVGAACSGVQAMALFGAVLALYLIAERPGGRRLAFWSFIGIAGVYVVNLIRLTTLMLVGYAWGADALEQVHAQAGWMFFVAWALIFVALARSRPGQRRPAAATVAIAD